MEVLPLLFCFLFTVPCSIYGAPKGFENVIDNYDEDDDDEPTEVSQQFKDIIDSTVVLNALKSLAGDERESSEDYFNGDEAEKEDGLEDEQLSERNYFEDQEKKNGNEDGSLSRHAAYSTDRKFEDPESPENVDANLKQKVTGDNNGDALGNDGDIMFRPGEEKAVFGNSNDEEADEEQVADISITNKRWTNGVVPYVIENSLGSSAKKAISAAVAEFNAKSCIRLIPRSTQANYVAFYKGPGCWSYIGMSEGKQSISLGSGCHSKKTAVHEVMHALGFWHEQARPDRDQYVTINWNNIEKFKKFKSQFDKRLPNTVTYLGHPYDYHSIMHYSKTAFGKKYQSGWFLGKKTLRRETITPKRQTSLGRCSTCGLSTIDASQLIRLYCSSPRTTVTAATLINELKMMMAAFNAQNNDVFRRTLLTHLQRIYPSYYWTISSYNAVYGSSTHYFRGYCGHVWRYHNKNVVACYSRKNVRLPSVTTRNNVANNVLASVRDKSCDAKWVVQTAWNKARSYKVPIAMVHNVRHGSGLRVQWHAHSYFWNYRCKRDCRQTGFWWNKKTTCTDHKSSLILMFGGP